MLAISKLTSLSTGCFELRVRNRYEVNLLRAVEITVVAYRPISVITYSNVAPLPVSLSATRK